MNLRLQLRDTARHAACAAFIRGAEPAQWLREIGRWTLRADQLACYLVPESIHSPRPAGLFVVVLSPAMLPLTDCLEPYGVVAGCLYVPTHADLWPATTPDELQRALLWPRQLFHPTIGLVGFDDADQLNLADLLYCGPPRPADWTLAHPGLPARPLLHQLRMLPPTVQDLVESFRQSVGTEPLADIKSPQEHAGPGRRALDTLSRGALKAALAAAQKLRELLTNGVKPGASPSAAGHSDAAAPDALGRLESWLSQNLAELEKKRQDEIQRLLAMFENNLDEALKYAIPLDSPYLNRGTAAPSFRLGLRSTLFDLGRLGGGGPVDVWNVDAYHDRLRTQYRAAAQREKDAGRFKKAAYIYAHLLGDYAAAADALERGGHFREAAVLYKDHLKNPTAAAECLERGGLLLEAVELFVGLNKHEKAGDLYRQIGQLEAAGRQYEQSVALAQANNDHLEAARLLADKLRRPNRALTTLLQGWHGTHSPESCLQRYFDVLAAHAPTALSGQVQPLFRHQTPVEKRPQFLQVLVAVNAAHPGTELQDASREVAYEILSAAAASGIVTHLPLLKKFLPDDRLVGSDCGRYATTQQPTTRANATTGFTLDPSIRWQSAVVHGNQLLALGLRDNKLHLARANWYGNLEYYSWPDTLAPDSRFRLLTDPVHSTRVILWVSGNQSLTSKNLLQNKYFTGPPLQVECLDRLPASTIGVGILPDDKLVAVADEGGMLAGSFTDPKGLSGPAYLGTDDYHYDVYSGFSTFPQQIFYRQQAYYCAFSDASALLSFQTRDSQQLAFDSSALHVDAPIQLLSISAYSAKTLFAVVTDRGTRLWWAQSQEPLTDNPLFGEDITEPLAAQFVAADKLVVAEAQRAVVFQLVENTGYARRTITTPAPIVAVLPTGNRHRFALLEANGRISTYDS